MPFEEKSAFGKLPNTKGQHYILIHSGSNRKFDFVLEHRACFLAMLLERKDCLLDKVFSLSCDFFHCG